MFPGLAGGDGLGRPVEFRLPTGIEREFGRLSGMVGGGTHGKPAGTITDDTDLALCIDESLESPVSPTPIHGVPTAVRC